MVDKNHWAVVHCCFRVHYLFCYCLLFFATMFSFSSGLREATVARESDVQLANPVLPDQVLQGLPLRQIQRV